jgi:hypothetical protein
MFLRPPNFGKLSIEGCGRHSNKGFFRDSSYDELPSSFGTAATGSDGIEAILHKKNLVREGGKDGDALSSVKRDRAVTKLPF